MKHEFQVGQFVELKPNLMRAAATGVYEITRLMPEPEISSESPRYCVKSSGENHLRIVPETDLTLASGPAEGPAMHPLERYSAIRAVARSTIKG